MRSFKLYIIIFFLAWAGNAFAVKYREIVLKDGTVFFAEIVGYKEGIYTLNVKDLGIYKVDELNIDVIRFKAWDESIERPEYGKRRIIKPPDNFDRELQNMRQFILKHPEIMKRILSVPNNPDAQNVLEDPKLMKALYFDEFETLFAHPVFIKLLKNPTAQSIVQLEQLKTKENVSSRSSGIEQNYKAQVQSFQTQMLNNVVLIQRILSLQNDPDVQKILGNPELMEAINAFDLETLLTSLEFTELFNNEKIQEILKAVIK